MSIDRFINEGGQYKLTDYPLAPHSIVFDVGGYEGEWTATLLQRGLTPCEHCGARQDPYVYIFEPVYEYYESCRQRFKDYPKVKAVNFGLSNRTFKRNTIFTGAATRLTDPETGDSGVDVKDIAEVVNDWMIPTIDLISINIEGEEYPLINRMIQTGVILNTRNIQIQFHKLRPECEGMRDHIQTKLAETHDKIWDYPFVWESWRRKGE